MRIVFRTDASRTIGHGHLMRCLTLASRLRVHGATALFVCREHEGDLCGLVEQRGFPVKRLPPPTLGLRIESEPTHAAWLGDSWENDVEQTNAALATMGNDFDWLVVDHYGIDARWETALAKSVKRIMVIDDLADRPHHCAVLLDQNLFENMRDRYLDKVPQSCALLLGPEYALLQPVYGELHDRIPPREGQIRRVLISFGGADRNNLTGRSIEAFLSLGRSDIELDAVFLSEARHAEEIISQAQAHRNVHVYTRLESLAPLIAKADIAIGAGGSTSWERLCLGLPSIVVTVAANQHSIAEALARKNLVLWLGHEDNVGPTQIAAALRNFLETGLDGDWSLRCAGVVDGKGATRTCSVLTLSEETSLLVRRARLADEQRFLGWSPDPDVAGPPAGGQISEQIRRESFRIDLRNIDACVLYVFQTPDSEPVGHARVERTERGWELSCTFSSAFRGRGLGELIKAAAISQLRREFQEALTFAGSRPNDRHAASLGGIPVAASSRRIAICCDKDSWMNHFVPQLVVEWLDAGHDVTWATDSAELQAGDMCFYLSYARIVPRELLARFRNNLVVHASELPKGRGWSPLTWQILEGASSIPITLFEASDSVDSGNIYLQERIELKGSELLDELRRLLAEATIRLCRRFVSSYPSVLGEARSQVGEATYYQRRHPVDSQLNVEKPLREYLNLLRVADNERYPAWINLNGRVVRLRVEG